MTHLDLFSGIGGFAYAVDQVFGDDVEHIFCDIDPFCRQVLKKHWPESEVYDDIRTITNAGRLRGKQGQLKAVRSEGKESKQSDGFSANQWGKRQIDILTGGFPCQPFSAAGARGGTADDRYLWPEMFRVIQLAKPTWVIAENVRGLVTWNEGMVLEQICTDLEAAGYEVQPLIIPAAAVNAPHRRDRIWFIACHAGSSESRRLSNKQPRQKISEARQSDSDVADSASDRRQRRGAKAKVEKGRPTRSESTRQLPHGSQRSDSNVTNAGGFGQLKGGIQNGPRQAEVGSKGKQEAERHDIPDWRTDWFEVAAEFCSVDDGVSVELDGLKLSKAGHRKEQLKAYGNAIVPQVAIEIMRSLPI